MGQVVQVNGDYKIKTGEGNDIVLDTGVGIGNVRVTGNLLVEGDTLTVEARQLNINDNIITLNSGETSNNGIFLKYSGLQVFRGPNTEDFPQASFTYNQNIESWQLAYGDAEAEDYRFSYGQGLDTVYSKLKLQQIISDNDTVNENTGRAGDLILLSNGSPGVLTLANVAFGYSSRVTEANDIPNKEYVDLAIQLNPTFQIVRSDTRVVAFDNDNSLDLTAFPVGPYVSQPTENKIGIVVDNTVVAEFFSDNVLLQNLNIFNEPPVPPFITIPGDIPNTIVLQASQVNQNIKLETSGTGKVEITYAIQLDNLGVSPSIDASKIKSSSSALYGGPVGAGTTGIYTVNQNYRDELINKNRAILFSMLF